MRIIPRTELILYLLLPSCIILTLTMVYFLPSELKNLFTLRYNFFSFSNPSDLLRLYTYHLIHYNLLHFMGNLVGFTIIYWALVHVVVRGDEVRTFKVMSFIIFLVVAPALGILDLILFSDTAARQGCGFSGILLAFNGMIPYFSFKCLARELNIDLRVPIIHLSFLVMASGLAIAYVETIRAVLFVAMGIVSITFYFYWAYNRYEIEDSQEVRERISLVMFTVSIFFFVIAISFPPELRTSHGIVNIWGHFMGLYLGMMVLYYLGLSLESTCSQKV